MKTTIITIGDTRIEVPQLTIGQLEEVAEWLEMGATLDKTMRAALGHNLRLLAIAFKTSTPTLTAEQIAALRATVGDVAAATTAVLRVAGLTEEEGTTTSPEVTAPDGASPPNLIESSANSPPAAGILPN